MSKSLGEIVEEAIRATVVDGDEGYKQSGREHGVLFDVLEAIDALDESTHICGESHSAFIDMDFNAGVDKAADWLLNIASLLFRGGGSQDDMASYVRGLARDIKPEVKRHDYPT